MNGPSAILPSQSDADQEIKERIRQEMREQQEETSSSFSANPTPKPSDRDEAIKQRIKAEMNPPTASSLSSKRVSADDDMKQRIKAEMNPPPQQQSHRFSADEAMKQRIKAEMNMNNPPSTSTAPLQPPMYPATTRLSADEAMKQRIKAEMNAPPSSTASQASRGPLALSADEAMKQRIKAEMNPPPSALTSEPRLSADEAMKQRIKDEMKPPPTTRTPRVRVARDRDQAMKDRIKAEMMPLPSTTDSAPQALSADDAMKQRIRNEMHPPGVAASSAIVEDSCRTSDDDTKRRIRAEMNEAGYSQSNRASINEPNQPVLNQDIGQTKRASTPQTSAEFSSSHQQQPAPPPSSAFDGPQPGAYPIQRRAYGAPILTRQLSDRSAGSVGSWRRNNASSHMPATENRNDAGQQQPSIIDAPVEAAASAPPSDPTEQKTAKRSRIYLIVLVGIFLVAIGLGVGLGVAGGGSSDDSPSTQLSDSDKNLRPTAPPQTRPPVECSNAASEMDPDIENLSDEEKEKYDFLLENVVKPTLGSDYEPENASCDHRHIAAIWLTSQDAFIPDKDEIIRYTNRFLLAVLYFSMSGEDWRDPRNDEVEWLTGVSECVWFGVSCDDTAQIISLDFTRTLSRLFPVQIPNEIGLFSHLRLLSFVDNGMVGAIPETVGLLKELEVLDLTSTLGLERVPMKELASLEKLTYLSFSTNPSNTQTLQIPSEGHAFQSLKYLALDNTNVQGSIPSSIGGLTNLVVLDIYKSSLSGAVPSEIGLLTKLEYLRMGVTGLTSLPSEVGLLTNLKSLTASQNIHWESSIPSELGRLTNLQNLNYAGTLLSGTVPSELGSCTSLKALIVTGLTDPGSIPMELGALTALTRLELSTSEMTGTIPASLFQIAKLSHLDLRENRLNVTAFPDLTAMTDLECIDLARNAVRVQEPIPAPFCSFEMDVMICSECSSELTITDDVRRCCEDPCFDDAIAGYGACSFLSVNAASNYDRIPPRVTASFQKLAT